ncbi:hypothetical protein GDO78_000739 [Eleutherodactylus coqui]|uniref:C2H2-type domain-containing protein n=1 Tax=Eleutherodactylus coqui TaxID=57060 RepID=A0A8J6KGS5_ELECQ|nr:hypothetical protein GDO78_000739 [Eleutherodactylus coqui]
MAELVMLARHLFMHEVLEICETVHKQMEEKQLTLYEKGDVQTVASETNVQVVHLEEAVGTPKLSMVKEVADGQQILTLETVTCPTSQSNTTSTSLSVGATLQLANDSDIPVDSVDATQIGSVDGTTAIYISNVATDQETTVLIPTVIEVSSVEPQETIEIIQEVVTSKTQLSSESPETQPSLPNMQGSEEPQEVPSHDGVGEEQTDLTRNTLQSGEAPSLDVQGSVSEDMDVDTSEENELGLKTREGMKKKHSKLPKSVKSPAVEENVPVPTVPADDASAEGTAADEVGFSKVDSQSSGTDTAVSESSGASEIDPYKSKLRERSVGEGGYMQLHRGREKKSLNRKPVLKSAVQQICQKAFTHKHGLKMHQALHEPHKKFKCHLCDKSFVTNRSLQEHVSTHTGEMKYLCTMCGKTFHRASGLSKHLRKHRPKPEVRKFHCTQCERSFCEARDLEQHMNKHLGVKPFECEVCGKCYSWKKDWYSHVKSHSVTEPYRCNICGKEFFEKSLFRRHVNKATHGKKGRIKRNIERVCTHCGKTFTQLREFRRHVNNHEGVKPFECLTCGVAWADARSLKRHVRTHTGERPYVCPVCNEAYIDARNLRKHMTKFHSNYITGKIMLEKDSLQFHHQGTQVEHAVSFLPNEAVESQSEIVTEEIETVLVSGDVVESIEDDDGTQVCSAVSSLSDQSIMQVVNYVLSQQQVVKLPEVTDHIDPVEVEVGSVSEVL